MVWITSPSKSRSAGDQRVGVGVLHDQEQCGAAGLQRLLDLVDELAADALVEQGAERGTNGGPDRDPDDRHGEHQETAQHRADCRAGLGRAARLVSDVRLAVLGAFHNRRVLEADPAGSLEAPQAAHRVAGVLQLVEPDDHELAHEVLPF